MTMEETRRRNEASMARKRANAKAINPAAANAGISQSDGPLSPSSTGAMDSLLEKLRAAAPQARDQRDRRRRARLKDRHQIRVASGQTMPELGEVPKNGSGDDDASEKALLSPTDATVNGEAAAADKMEPISEGEDVAERAASMLQGLRGDGADGDPTTPGSRDSSLRVRRRRESADDERRNRRRRRARETSSTNGDEVDSVLSPKGEADPMPEIREPDGQEDEDDNGAGEKGPTSTPPREMPQTVVVPPSPEGTAKRPVVLDDD